MFSQSLSKGSEEAQIALQRLTTFLESEGSSGRISPALQKKVLGMGAYINICKAYDTTIKMIIFSTFRCYTSCFVRLFSRKPTISCSCKNEFGRYGWSVTKATRQTMNALLCKKIK